MKDSVASTDLFGDFPSFDVLHVPLHDPPDFGHVNPGSVARQFPFEFGRQEFEILTKHLEQRRIEANLILMQLEPETGPHAFALQADWDKQQRRTIGAGAVLWRPLQDPKHR